MKTEKRKIRFKVLILLVLVKTNVGWWKRVLVEVAGVEPAFISVFWVFQRFWCPYRCPTLHCKQEFLEVFLRGKRGPLLWGPNFLLIQKLWFCWRLAWTKSIQQSIWNVRYFKILRLEEDRGSNYPQNLFLKGPADSFIVDSGSETNGPGFNRRSWKTILMLENQQSNSGNASKPWRIPNRKISRMGLKLNFWISGKGWG